MLLANNLLILLRSYLKPSFNVSSYAFTQKVELDEAIEPAVSADEKIDGDDVVTAGVEVVVEKLGALGVLDTGFIFISPFN